MSDTRQKRFKMPQMEGAIAQWYARQRGSGPQMDAYRTRAEQILRDLPSGADVLEVAPGPGYFAIELARTGKLHVSTLDISRTFVEIATDNARRAGVTIDIRHGNVERMPFEADSFDLIVCQAAFKNFERPVSALDEMHRVLRAGGTALIEDMSREASASDIDQEVRGMELSRLNAFATRSTLRMLRLRAASRAQFERLVSQSAFGGCVIASEGISMQVRLAKPATH